jgi:uncharacterized membrane protein YoaK (UPF0700 family)
MSDACNLTRITLLCVVGGCADAIAYLRYGTFVGAMTGNTVLLGIDIAQWRLDGAVFHLSIIAAFLLAVVLTRAVLDGFPVIVPLTFTALMLATSDLITNQWSAALCAAALGLQNAAVRKIGGVSVNSVFVTGDLLRLGSAIPRMGTAKQQDQVILLGAAWVAYAIGAVFGAAALHTTNHPMIVPAIVAVVAAVVEAHAERQPAGDSTGD